jgi:hypothetical protein
MTFDPSKGHPVPSSAGNAPAPSGADSQLKAAESGIPEGSQPDQKLQGAKSDINSPPKLSVSLSVGSVAGLIDASVDDTLPFAPENKIQTI